VFKYLVDKKILLIDDSKVSLIFFENIFQSEGAIVTSTSDPRSGVELTKKHPYDCILTDLEMPELTGIEVCELIKQNELNKNTPVIILTSKNEKDFIIDCLSRGADEFICKNEQQHIIQLKINACIRLKVINDEIRKLSQLDAIKEMIVTYEHEFNNLLAILEMDVQGHLKTFHEDDSQCMDDLVDVTGNLIKLVGRINSLSVFNEKLYTDGIKMVDLDVD